MKVVRVLAFGIASGLVWSLAPGLIAGLYGATPDSAAVLMASVLAGTLVSLTLYKPLENSSPVVAVLLGISALPLGGFFFGLCLSFVRLALFAEYGPREKFAPISSGLMYAVFGTFSIIAITLIPLAIATTWLLRRLVLNNQNGLR